MLLCINVEIVVEILFGVFFKEVTRVMQEKVNNSVIAKCFLDPLRNLGKP